jgi:glycosyltransferase involved in cell wall biosynthesis
MASMATKSVVGHYSSHRKLSIIPLVFRTFVSKFPTTKPVQVPIYQEITLIYDRDVTGHHLDFLQFLVAYLKKQPAEVQRCYIFVVNPAAKARFEKYGSSLRFHYMTQSEIDGFENETNFLKKKTAELYYLEKLASVHAAKRVILMHLDAFQYELGRSHWQKSPLRFSGILFLPFRVEYETGFGLLTWLKQEFKGIRKSLQTKWMLQNKNLKTIFILNDAKGVSIYNNRHDDRFVFLPDPAPDFSADLPTQSIELTKAKYGIAPNRKVLLVFGNISDRKNVENIIMAIALLSEAERQQVTLLICGEPDPHYAEHLQVIVREAIQRFGPELIVARLQFVSPAESDSLFKMASMIVAPQINFYNSSGAVALAAKYNIPVIVSKPSLAGDIVTQYNLGQAVNPSQPNEIAESMGVLLKNNVIIDGSAYLKEFSTDIFCETLL